MANTTALTAEFSPPHRRAFYVAMMFCSFSLGAGFGGFVAAELMPVYGWESIFLICGVMAVALLPFLIVALAGIAASKRMRKPHHSRQRSCSATAGRAFTILIWIIFFANLMELYILTSWLPTTIRRSGRGPRLGSDRDRAPCSSAVSRAHSRSRRWSTAMARASCLPVAFVTAALSVALLGLLRHLGSGHSDRRGRRRRRHGRRPELQQRHRRQVLPDRDPGDRRRLGAGGRPHRFDHRSGRRRSSAGDGTRSPSSSFAMVPPLVAAAAYLVMGNPKELSQPRRLTLQRRNHPLSARLLHCGKGSSLLLAG